MTDNRRAPGTGMDSGGDGAKRPWYRHAFDMLPWRLLRRLNFVERNYGARIAQAERGLDDVRDAFGGLSERSRQLSESLDGTARRLDTAEEALRFLQVAVEQLSSERVPAVEVRLDGLGKGLGEANSEIAALRDGSLPKLEVRSDQLEARSDRFDDMLTHTRSDLEARSDQLEVRSDQLEARSDLLEVRSDQLETRSDHFDDVLSQARRDLEARSDQLEERSDQLEDRSTHFEDVLTQIRSGLEHVRDEVLPAQAGRYDSVEHNLGRTDGEVARLRDVVIPAGVRRSNALLEKLYFELAETSSLVERMLRREPLPVPKASAFEDGLAEDLAEVQPLLVESFRGSEQEIVDRLAVDLERLAAHAPVVDLGCGRGELLLALRERGVDSFGIEADPALAQGARRRGLRILEGDALETLRETATGSVGAVTAYHVLEHLSSAGLLALVKEVHRVLRPGGIFLVECPNPHSLRVGASLFWLDPTHLRPLLPETLSLYLMSTGFEIQEPELRHPFAENELMSAGAAREEGADGLGSRLSRLENRLDELLNGPRDFAILAEKPALQVSDSVGDD
jgi:SAM-dependent methyltransferase/ABC-type transporter Mla subunit MlaD